MHGDRAATARQVNIFDAIKEMLYDDNINWSGQRRARELKAKGPCEDIETATQGGQAYSDIQSGTTRHNKKDPKLCNCQPKSKFVA